VLRITRRACAYPPSIPLPQDRPSGRRSASRHHHLSRRDSIDARSLFIRFSAGLFWHIPEAHSIASKLRARLCRPYVTRFLARLLTPDLLPGLSYAAAPRLEWAALFCALRLPSRRSGPVLAAYAALKRRSSTVEPDILYAPRIVRDLLQERRSTSRTADRSVRPTLLLSGFYAGGGGGVSRLRGSVRSGSGFF